MDSWRDTTSAEAQQALDDLLNTALELAGQQVGKQGCFLPFAITTTLEGPSSVEMIGDDVDSLQMIELLWTGLRDQRDELAAAAVVVDVRLDDDGWTDGIRVEAEHRDGIALQIVAPYQRRRLRRAVEYGELCLAPGEPQIW